MSEYNPIKTKRIYEEPSAQDGYRVLVDRLWPRGVSKEDARMDAWMKEVAPSTELRKWFDHHDPQKFGEFRLRYLAALIKKGSLLDDLLECSHKENVTLLYAAKDEEHNHARVLADVLNERQNLK